MQRCPPKDLRWTRFEQADSRRITPTQLEDQLGQFREDAIGRLGQLLRESREGPILDGEVLARAADAQFVRDQYVFEAASSGWGDVSLQLNFPGLGRARRNGSKPSTPGRPMP